MYSQIRVLKDGYYLNWLQRLHKNRPKTFSISFFGIRQICTLEIENLKEFARYLVNSFFYREVYSRIDLMTLLPQEDGVTFDAQPLIQRWSLDLTSDLIFGQNKGSIGEPSKADIAWAMLTILKGGRLRIQFHRLLWAFKARLC
ncbi:uncharacterized protein F5Z01DRAFT_670126 [Emericellopsis atlantica]|uniref:Uncharacterized protein n=1 Tax=Emericellopsis atlantica TaxID=2614577 RepID=A0A9P7ZVA9_9HYPO|nr:uncharacterized protein F5Z01DRAFT_670126 [Emericellopsis atlantica]KAG9258407.1 hypothetical protein F5Z01DRAFT_670126 [Emericellopsis atlantica]